MLSLFQLLIVIYNLSMTVPHFIFDLEIYVQDFSYSFKNGFIVQQNLLERWSVMNDPDKP